MQTGFTNSPECTNDLLTVKRPLEWYLLYILHYEISLLSVTEGLLLKRLIYRR